MLGLRQDLTLVTAEADADGTPAWVLHDPAQNRFFRLGPVEIEFLLANTPDHVAMAQHASARLGRQVTAGEAMEFHEFLRRNNLLQAQGEAERKRLLEQRAAAKPAFVAWLIKNYLSVRIPLVRPDRFLSATVSYLEWWFDSRLKWVMAGLGLLGLVLVGLRWDQFMATAVDYFTPKGIVAYAIAIAMIKVVHELGHAYTVKRYGGRVPVIGVSFIVFWPVLYTDTNDAWSFSRAARIEVDAAGMKAELTVAVMALLLWLLLPDGTLRGLAFLACTTSLVLTFLVNLNPLMRFDGYYLLSDTLGVENLQERATALARWKLREWLFDLRQSPPETPNLFYVVFAVAGWIYRLTLTLSIAAFVYAVFFKLLGAALMALQLWNYVLRPAWREIAMLKEYWPKIRTRRRFWGAGAVLVSLVLLLLVPIKTTVSFPGQIQAVNSRSLYTAVGGEVTAIGLSNHASVDEDAVLLTVRSPDLAFERQQIDSALVVLRWQMETQSVEAPWLRQSLVTEANLRTTLERRETLGRRAEQEKVTIAAPASIIDMTRDLRPGQWIGEGEFVARSIDMSNWEVEGYVAENDLARISEGMTGYFFFADGMRARRSLKVVEVEPASTKESGPSPLLSVFGGPLLSRQAGAADAYAFTAAYYRVRLIADAGPGGNFPQQLAGRVVLTAQPDVLLTGFLTRAVQFLRREMSF